MRKGKREPFDDFRIPFLHILPQKSVERFEIAQFLCRDAYGAVVAKTDIAFDSQSEIELQLLQIFLGYDDGVARYVLRLGYVDYVACEIHEHMIFPYCQVPQIDTAFDLAFEAYQNGGGFQPGRMREQMQVAEIVHHYNVLMVTYQFRYILFEKPVDRYFVLMHFHDKSVLSF